MAGRISEDFINEVRGSVNIVDVISQYVSLEKRGKDYVGLCPFHQEKTPSFSVNPDKQQGLAARFHVASLPTLVILHDGEIVYSRAGVARLTELEALIDTVTAVR